MCMAMKALTQRVQLLQLSRFRRHSSGTLSFVFLLIVVVTACDLGAAPSCDLGFGSGGGSGIGPAFDGIEAAGEGVAGAGEVVGEFIEQIESVGSSVWYEVEDSAVRVSWDLVDGADYYKVYYSDFISFCTLSRDGSPSYCEELAGNVVGTTYVHADPDSNKNYYWVVACNRGGCSDIDSGNLAALIETGPAGPANVWYEVEDSAVRVSWDLVDGADYYKVYYSDFIDSFCTLSREGSPSFCEELAGNVVGTTYVHADPDSNRNYYWVVACNRGSCSDIDSGNPAAPIETGPAGPANVEYEVEDSEVRVSWDLVDGADYYNVYYSDFIDSFCTLSREGSPSFCEELAGNVVGTTYVHADPDSNRNYYWVVACNRGGCSDIDSNNPAEDASLSTTAPTASPSPEQPRPPSPSPEQPRPPQQLPHLRRPSLTCSVGRSKHPRRQATLESL